MRAVLKLFLLLAASLAVSAAIAACGSTCGPSNCTGCCDATNQCQVATVDHCGKGGLACSTCVLGQSCVLGNCQFNGRTGAGAGSGDGASSGTASGTTGGSSSSASSGSASTTSGTLGATGSTGSTTGTSGTTTSGSTGTTASSSTNGPTSVGAGSTTATTTSTVGSTGSTSSTASTTSGTASSTTSSTSGSTTSGTAGTGGSTGGACTVPPSDQSPTIDNAGLGDACIPNDRILPDAGRVPQQGSCSPGQLCAAAFSGYTDTICTLSCGDFPDGGPTCPGSNGSTQGTVCGFLGYCLPVGHSDGVGCPAGLQGQVAEDPYDVVTCTPPCTAASQCGSVNPIGSPTCTAGRCHCTSDFDCLFSAAGPSCDPVSGACFTACSASGTCATGSCCLTYNSNTFCDASGR